MNQFIESKKEDFSKAEEFFKKEISTLRTGRANPGIFDGIFVDAYGVKNPLNTVGGIGVNDARSMVITPFDRGIIKDIEKAIVEANLGVGVMNEGDKIRVTIPQMTEENRKDLVKKLNEKFEKARISLRQIREEVKNNIESAEESKEINEDDKFRFLKELDEEIKKKNDQLEAVRSKKESDVMTI